MKSQLSTLRKLQHNSQRSATSILRWNLEIRIHLELFGSLLRSLHLQAVVNSWSESNQSGSYGVGFFPSILQSSYSDCNCKCNVYPTKSRHAGWQWGRCHKNMKNVNSVSDLDGNFARFRQCMKNWKKVLSSESATKAVFSSHHRGVEKWRRRQWEKEEAWGICSWKSKIYSIGRDGLVAGMAEFHPLLSKAGQATEEKKRLNVKSATTTAKRKWGNSTFLWEYVMSSFHHST